MRVVLITLIILMGCNKTEKDLNINGQIINEKIQNREMLDCMYSDSYFPKFLVDKCKKILIDLCVKIENTKPKNTKELYKLTHAATNKLNDLQQEFLMAESEIETAARECLGAEFAFIAESYKFEYDIEEIIGTRDW